MVVSACGGGSGSTGEQASIDGPASAADLPALATFRSSPSDQFLVDLTAVRGGHPFKGTDAAAPHAGAHVLFDSGGAWPQGGSGPSSYPAIRAVADGVVDRVTNSMHVGTNDRYGVMVGIAQDPDGTRWDFEYSIEPMVPEASPGFCATFLTVTEGQAVHKGDVIDFMYVPPAASGTHIHFELLDARHQRFAAPAIFTPEIVNAFAERWGSFGVDATNGVGPQLPPAMGWKLAAPENPFGTGAVDTFRTAVVGRESGARPGPDRSSSGGFDRRFRTRVVRPWSLSHPLHRVNICSSRGSVRSRMMRRVMQRVMQSVMQRPGSPEYSVSRSRSSMRCSRRWVPVLHPVVAAPVPVAVCRPMLVRW